VGCYHSFPERHFSAVFGDEDANCCDEVASQQQPSANNVLSAGKTSACLQLCSRNI